MTTKSGAFPMPMPIRARRCPTCARVLARGRRICPVCALKSRLYDAVTEVSQRNQRRADWLATRVARTVALLPAPVRRPPWIFGLGMVPLVGVAFLWSTYADSKVGSSVEALCASERLAQMVGFPPEPREVAKDLVGVRGRIGFGRPFGVVSASLEQFSPAADDRAYLKYQTAIYDGTCRLDVGDYHCMVTLSKDKTRRIDIGGRLER